MTPNGNKEVKGQVVASLSPLGILRIQGQDSGDLLDLSKTLGNHKQRPNRDKPNNT